MPRTPSKQPVSPVLRRSRITSTNDSLPMIYESIPLSDLSTVTISFGKKLNTIKMRRNALYTNTPIDTYADPDIYDYYPSTHGYLPPSNAIEVIPDNDSEIPIVSRPMNDIEKFLNDRTKALCLQTAVELQEECKYFKKLNRGYGHKDGFYSSRGVGCCNIL